MASIIPLGTNSRRSYGSSFYDSTAWYGDCLVWTAALFANGYGAYGDPDTRKLRYAHIYAWEMEHGPVPDGLQLDHVWERGCRWRNCVLVDHLEPVTSKENHQRWRSVQQRQ